MDHIFNEYCPKNKISRKEKNPNKFWLTTGILKSIKVRSKLSKQFCNCRNIHQKIKLQGKYQTYQNQVEFAKKDTLKTFLNKAELTVKSSGATLGP